MTPSEPFEIALYVAPHGPDEACTCEGCWACNGHVEGCTCDIDWDAMAEARLQ